MSENERTRAYEGNRALILHPESDCYFEIFTDREYGEALDGGECVDVTGDPVHEKLYQLYKAAK